MQFDTTDVLRTFIWQSRPQQSYIAEKQCPLKHLTKLIKASKFTLQCKFLHGSKLRLEHVAVSTTES
jgi:hypothetical protein